MVPIPIPEDYDVSSTNGFLPTSPPLEALPDSYYEPWEYVVRNLQGLILSKRLREVVGKLPTLTTDHLTSEAEWRRAYSLLGFIVHAYIWVGPKPADRVPPCISIPFLAICKHLQLPPVATYAGVVLWNWKPIFNAESVDTLANLDTINTFTGSLDEKWFYIISIAIEARGAPIIPMMLQAISAAESDDRERVTSALQSFAERLSELCDMLTKMYENCDPHIFYHRIRPFLAGSKNMADAGLPNGVIFDNGGAVNRQRYVQFSGGSNAQSSIIQFFDIVLGVQHSPTGTKTATQAAAAAAAAATNDEDQKSSATRKPAPASNFILEMRKYMPGPHARFLRDVARVANIHTYVAAHAAEDRGLAIAYDACLAMLRAFRDAHIQMVSRYIIVKSREAGAKAKAAAEEQQKRKQKLAMEMKEMMAGGEQQQQGDEKVVNLAHRSAAAPSTTAKDGAGSGQKRVLRGTGGSSLIPFLRQARDETGEPAIDAWTRRLLRQERAAVAVAAVAVAAAEGQTEETKRSGLTLSVQERLAGERRNSVQGLAGIWAIDEFGSGGLCHV